jgi:hypothetical protein
VASFVVGATPRRSTSSLGVSLSTWHEFHMSSDSSIAFFNWAQVLWPVLPLGAIIIFMRRRLGNPTVFFSFGWLMCLGVTHVVGLILSILYLYATRSVSISLEHLFSETLRYTCVMILASAVLSALPVLWLHRVLTPARGDT